MKYRHLFNILLLVAVAIFSSCAWDDHATVTINLQRNDLAHYKPEVKNEISIIDKIIAFITMSRDAEAKWNSDHTSATSSLSLTISADDMETIVAQIPGTATSYTVKVPSGTRRNFKIVNNTTLNAVPVNWMGVTTEDLSPGASVEIPINMFPMTKVSASPATMATLNVSWIYTAAGSPWPVSVTSINQVKIYRSEKSEGPYVFLKTVTFSSSTTIDSGLISGKVYYYKISIMSTYGEGEKTDSAFATAPF